MPSTPEEMGGAGSGKEDDDDISLASTISENEDDGSWAIERIIYEGYPVDQPDEMKFLVRWTGFGPSSWTWEPHSAIPESSLLEWDEIQARVAAREEEPYLLSTYQKACKDALQAQLDRHNRRNKRRRILGKKPTRTGEGLERRIKKLQNPILLHHYEFGAFLDNKDDESTDSDDGRVLVRKPSRLGDKPRSRPNPSSTAGASKTARAEARAAERREAEISATIARAASRTPVSRAARLARMAATAREIAPPWASVGNGARSSVAIRESPHSYGSRSREPAKKNETVLGERKKAVPKKSTGRPNSTAISTGPTSPTSPTGPTGSRPGPKKPTPAQAMARNVFDKDCPGPRTRRRVQPASRDPASGHHYRTLQSLNRASKHSRSREDAAPKTVGRIILASNPRTETWGSNTSLPTPDDVSETEEAAGPEATIPPDDFRPGTTTSSPSTASLTSLMSPTGVTAESTPARSSRYLKRKRPTLSRRISASPPRSSRDTPDRDLDLAPLPKRGKNVSFADGHVTAAVFPPAPLGPHDYMVDDPDPDADIYADGSDEDVAMDISPSPSPVEEVGLFCEFDQAMPRWISLAANPGREIAAVFDKITAVEREPWLAAFEEDDNIMSFTHLCEASDFIFKLPNLRKRTLSAGMLTASSATHRNLLENVAEHLMQGGFGAGSFQDHCAVLLYPTGSDRWARLDNFVREELYGTEAVGVAAGAAASGDAPHTLSFYVFEITPSCVPLDYRTGELESLKGLAGLARNSTAGARSLVFEAFFGIRYRDILPSSVVPAPPSDHSFFVAFPEAHEPERRAILNWLQACNPQSRRALSTERGHWSYFSAQKTGVVIIHEAMLPDIRCFPRLFAVLEKPRTAFRFWVMRPAPPAPAFRLDPDQDEDPDRPSEPAGLADEALPTVGHPTLTEIFPYGDVFMLTPSFLLSRPNEANDFFKWIQGCKDHFKIGWTMVIPSKMDDHLKELVCSCPSDDLTISRMKLWQKFRLITRQSRSCFLHPLMSPVRHPFLIFVDSCVDPNDEQSLVNWFGLWSLMNLDKYRRFYVIGSLPSSHGMHRIIRFPSYHPATAGDLKPSRLREVEKPAPTVDQPPAAAAAEAAAAAVAVTPLGPGLTAPLSRLAGDKPEDLKAALGRLEQKSLHADECKMFIYKFPVAYCDMTMADLHKDRQATRLEVYSHWFKFFRPNTMRALRRNTYTGLFYTPPDDPTSQTRFNDFSQWHPWAAMFRPIILIKPYAADPWSGEERVNGQELIIWDPVASSRHEQAGRACVDLAEYDLIPAQRLLIRLVQEMTPTVANCEAWPHNKLDRVWMGGFNVPKDAIGAHPLDATVIFLEEAMANIQKWLPLGYMHLRDRGFRPVVPAKELKSQGQALPLRSISRSVNKVHIKSSSNSSNSSVIVSSDMGSSHFEIGTPTLGELGLTGVEGQQLSMVIHPPRGEPRDGPSLYRNDLYHKAVEARMRRGGEPRTDTFMYIFRPTSEWWAEQKADGRHFEHVRVDTCDKVINRFKSRVPHPPQAAQAAQAPR